VKRNNLHSFTLWPKSSEIVQRIKHGRKSQFVSKAIIWYDTPAGEQARSHQELIERYRVVCIEREELRKTQSFISKLRRKWSK